MGREELLTNLTDWCLTQTVEWEWGDGLVQARLLTGPGGAGKTRLASELASHMTSRGWTAIRLTPNVGTPLGTLSQVCRPLLVIVDYAETRIAQLHELLDVVEHDQSTNPVRILALARATGDWWIRATQHPRSQALGAATVTPVPALHHSSRDRVTAYRKALNHFSDRLRHVYPGLNWQALLSRVCAVTALPALTAEEFDSPLSIQMAALLTLLDSTGTPQQTGVQTSSLEGRLLGHEQKYWDDTANSPERGLTGERCGSETRSLAVALASLAPATDRDNARTLLTNLPGLEDASAAGIRGALSTWLADLYPAPEGSVWGSLQPDRIAEHHIGIQVMREPGVISRYLANLDVAQAFYALNVLARTGRHAQYNSAVEALLRESINASPTIIAPAALISATQTPYPDLLIATLSDLTKKTSDTSLLKVLHDFLPSSTLTLANYAETLTTSLVDALKSQPVRDTQEHFPDLALALNSQSNRLAEIGRKEEALRSASQAIEIYEALIENRQGDHLANLAMALNNKSNRLAEIGRRAESLQTMEEAVRYWRHLAGKQPDAYLYRLAMALNNKANRLADIGRWPEALSFSDESIQTFKSLPEDQQRIHLPGLAMALSSQSNRFAQVGKRLQALEAATESVGYWRTVTGDNPDSFLPELAKALTTQSAHFSELGEIQKAVEVGAEAVKHYRYLSKAHPEAFRPFLAVALNNQSNHLHALGNYSDALCMISEAVEFYRPLIKAHPDAFLANFAAFLGTQSTQLAEAGKFQEALDAINEAIDIYRPLARDHPNAFLPNLAVFLGVQSNRLAAAGNPQEALGVINEAIEICAPLAENHPAAFLPELAVLLHYQSRRLIATKEYGRALISIDRSIEIFDDLSNLYPARFGEYLASSIEIRDLLKAATQDS
ncbi:tetratricopeptide repeat protein [Streptomyces sp. NPDC020681]|uniref:tetratricopeptide repeat protein n=1 Tax=Streptomyces sp. NPDC020681 TaxID=3365083 RepID=UPI0037A4A659